MDSIKLKNIQIIQCNEEKYSQSILDILNDSIINSTALYDYKPRNLESMKRWFQVKIENNFPVIGAINDTGELLGFSTWGTFRSFPAYKYSVEHSIYIHPNHRGKGVSKVLIQALIEQAIIHDVHVIIGCIDSSNVSSIHLHEKFGFKYCGTIKEVGYKFGEWLDASFYQLILKTPNSPYED